MTSFETLEDLGVTFEEDELSDNEWQPQPYDMRDHYEAARDCLVREIEICLIREKKLEENLAALSNRLDEEIRLKGVYKQKVASILGCLQPPRKKKRCGDLKNPACEVCGEKPSGGLTTIKRISEPTGDWAICIQCRITCPDCKEEYIAYDAYLHCLCSSE